MRSQEKLGSRLAASLDRLLAVVDRRFGRRRRDAAATDLVVSAILVRGDGTDLADPAGFAGFLRECFGRLSFRVTEVGDGDRNVDLPGLRFQTLLDQLSQGVPPIRERDAVRIARIADDLVSRTDPFERTAWAADVGVHARIASSFGRKGRLLATVVRSLRVERALEIGTAYGMSALFIAAAMGDRGRLVTAERSEPQAGVATELLAREHPDSVTVLAGIATELQATVRDRLGDADFLFHDGEHSRRAYVDDFASFEPLLASGAVVVYDDIDWPLARGSEGTDAYAGWREVVAHERVRRAVEVDRELGLLLLR